MLRYLRNRARLRSVMSALGAKRTSASHAGAMIHRHNAPRRSKRKRNGAAMRTDFSSQAYFRNPADELARLRAAGPVVEIEFPLIGKTWTTTTQEMADRVLKDSVTFTIRRDDGAIVGMRWWMPA